MSPDHSPPRLPAISAHRGGREAGPAETYQAYGNAVAGGADYVEVDARATSDGVLVAFHSGRTRRGGPVASISYGRLCRLAGYEVPRIADLLPLLAGQAGLHLDVKEGASAAAAVQLALSHLAPGDVVATTRDQVVARALARRFPVLQIGLAVGGDLSEDIRFIVARARRPSLSRLDAVTAAGASCAAIHFRLARAGLAAQCRERGIKTLVWTVNTDDALAWWLASRDVDVLVTDRPARAVALRAQSSAPR